MQALLGIEQPIQVEHTEEKVAACYQDKPQLALSRHQVIEDLGAAFALAADEKIDFVSNQPLLFEQSNLGL